MGLYKRQYQTMQRLFFTMGLVWVYYRTHRAPKILKDLIMIKQSVNFTPPNNEWLNAKVASEEYPNKTDIINDLIRREREREEKFYALKAAIEEGLSSGISDKTVEDIRTTY